MQRLFLFLFALIIVVASVAGGTYWWFNRRATLPLSTTTNPPSNITRPSLADVPLDQLFDPFQAEPCFLTTNQACVFALRHFPNQQPNQAQVIGFRTIQPLRLEDTNFFTGRMLAVPTPYAAIFAAELRAQTDPNNFYINIVEMNRIGRERGINPAFLFIFYNELATAISRSGQDPITLADPNAPTPDALTTALVQALTDVQNPGTLSQAEQAITALPWTKAGRAVVLAAARSLSPEIVTQLFSEAGSLENSYNALFAPTDVGGLALTIQLTGQSLSAESFYLTVDALTEDPTPFISLCQNNRALMCQRTETTLSCDHAPFLNLFCEMHLLNLP